MKDPLFYLILLVIATTLANQAHAQTQSGVIAVSQKFGEQKIDTFKVTLTAELISLKYKQQQLNVATIQALDSFMKKIPDLSHLEDTSKARTRAATKSSGFIMHCTNAIAM